MNTVAKSLTAIVVALVLHLVAAQPAQAVEIHPPVGPFRPAQDQDRLGGPSEQ